MFAERKQRRVLQESLDEINDQLLTLRHSTDPRDLGLRSKLQGQLSGRKRKLDIFESRLLETKATQLGIDLPHKADWWFDDSEEQYMSGVPTAILNDLTTRWLSPVGRMMVSALIKDKKDVRFDRRFKIILASITALTGLAGALIGVLAILSKCL